MVATFNKGAPAAYYRQTLAYYATGISSFWFAPDKRLGVSDGAPVDFGAFENLYAGLDAHGNSLARNTGGHTLSRVPAFDITLSPDKTFGIVRALAGPELGAAMDQLLVDASCDSLTVGQDLGGWRRRGKGGMRLDPVSLTAGVFAHTDSRPALHSDGETFSDMNPHLHAVVFNNCVSADGSAGSLHSVLLRRSKMAVGAAFHASLAAGLAELGFVIEETGPNGLFQIAGISPELVRYFSSRRNEIEDALAEAGTTSAQSPALAANAAERTRQTKVNYTEEEQREIWRAACTRLGFDPDKIVGQALAVVAVPAAKSGEELYKQRLSALVQELTENEAVFSPFELKRSTLAALVGTGLPVSRAQSAKDELMRLGMVQVGVDALGLAVFSTKEMVRTEMSVVALARDLSRASGFALDPAVVAAACAKRGLSKEQTDAALAATQSGHICLIEGAPGSGKSTTLAVPASCYQAAGCKVIAAATAWKIAKGLGQDLGVEAKATAAWLAALKRGEKVLDDKTVLVVDEVGLLSGADTEGLLQAAKDAGAKIILVGDRQQLRPIGAASGWNWSPEASAQTGSISLSGSTMSGRARWSAILARGVPTLVWQHSASTMTCCSPAMATLRSPTSSTCDANVSRRVSSR